MRDPILRGVRRLFALPRADVRREVDDEIAFHLESRVAELRAAGMDLDAARRRAVAEYGDLRESRRELVAVDEHRERHARWADRVDATRRDLVYAARSLRRQPGFAIGVILVLALGIGANATMFGIVDRLLLRPPAHVAAPERLMTLTYLRTHDGETGVQHHMSYPMFVELRESGAFQHVAAYSSTSLATGRGAAAELLRGMKVSANYFATLGVHPAAGRFFRADEDGNPTAPNVAVISFGYWQRAFAGNVNAIGASLDLAGAPFEIVGVAPPGFTGIEGSASDVWIPLTAGVSAKEHAGWTTSRNGFWLLLAARLPENGSRDRAAAMATQAIRAGATRDGMWTTRYAEQDPRIGMYSVLPREARADDATAKVALLLAAVSLLVLLIACANVANLQLARAIARRREIAVRIALGVSRARLLGQMLTESLLLALAGGVAALLVAKAGIELLRRVLLTSVAWTEQPALDARLFAYLAVAALGAGVLSGLAPAIQATRPRLVGALKEGTRTGGGQQGRTRAALLLVQTALSVVLLIAAGLFTLSLDRIRSLPLGLEPDRVLFGSVVTSGLGLSDADRLALYDRLHRAADAMPDVEHAALATSLPFYSSWATAVSVPGRDSLPRIKDGGPYFNAVTPEFFDVMGMRLLRGRAFSDADHARSARTVVINESLARLWWPGEEALGRCMRIGGDTMPCAEVVGVVANSRRQTLVEETTLQYFIPIGQAPAWADARQLVIRPRGDVSRAAEPIRRQLQIAEANLPYIRLRPMEALTDPQARSWRLGATIFTAFGMLALVLAGLGLYSMLAYDVTQRTHELGVRVALGAGMGNLAWLVLSRSFRVAAVGWVIGVLLALGAGRWIERLLFETSVRDAGVYTAVLAILGVVALVATLVPMWRTTRVNPIIALRAD